MRYLILAMLLLIATPVAAALWALPAFGATINVHTTDSGNKFIIVSGEIVPGDAEVFKNTLNSIHDVKPVVALAGPGGQFIAGMSIAAQVVLNRLATFVPADKECDSICGVIWIAGAKRFMTPTSQIGFHAAYNGEDSAINPGQVSSNGNAQIGAFYAVLHLNMDAIDYLTKAGPREMNYLSAAKAAELAIDVQVIDQSKLTPAPESMPREPGYAYQPIPPQQEQLGDMNAWARQWAQCLADVTHTVKESYDAVGFQWLNECTIHRGNVRYRLVVYTRWWQAFDFKACALSHGISICRDFLNGAYDCFASYQPQDPFLRLSACTPSHWALWKH
jgi:hypothetical protein